MTRKDKYSQKILRLVQSVFNHQKWFSEKKTAILYFSEDLVFSISINEDKVKDFLEEEIYNDKSS